MARKLRIPPSVALAALLAASALGDGVAGERMSSGVHGVSFEFPDGWTTDIVKSPSTAGKAGFGTEIKAACVTERCRTTQETCRIWIYDEVIGGVDGDPLAGLYRSAGEKYDLTRTILMRTGEGARVARAVGTQTFGATAWAIIETQAAGAYKSVIFARTSVAGRDIMVDGRTCERGEPRFEAARAIIASARVSTE